MPLPFTPLSLQKNIEPLTRQILSPHAVARFAMYLPHRLNIIAVEQLLNRAFAEQIEDGDFDFLQNRVLQIEMIDAELFVGISFEQKRLLCRHFGEQGDDSDVTLSIATTDAIDLIQQKVDPDTLFFQRKLKIMGDTELAHQVKNKPCSDPSLYHATDATIPAQNSASVWLFIALMCLSAASGMETEEV